MKQQKPLQVGIKSLLMNPEGKILLLKKNPNHYKGATAYWDIPGGRIELDVDLIKNLKRELKEEAGISSAAVSDWRKTPPVLLGAQDIIRPHVHVVRLTYISRVTSSKVTLNGEEHTDHVWVKVSELLRYKRLDPFLSKLLKDKKVVSLIKSL